MNFIGEEEIIHKDLGDLFSYLEEIKSQVLPFELTFEPVSDVLLINDEISMDDLKDVFVFNHGERQYRFPSANEKKKYDGLSFLGHETLPAKGFFWEFETIIEPFPFGIIDVTFSIKRIGLATDLKHIGERNVFKQDYPFYYDFESGVYVQVSLKGNTAPEYLKRKKLYAHLRKRLEDENLIYRSKLEAAAKELGKQGWLTETSIPKVRSLFSNYIGFIADFRKYFLIKLMYAQVDQDHYDRLVKHIDRLVIDANLGLESLETFENRGWERFIQTDIRQDDLLKLGKQLQGVRNEIAQFFFHQDKLKVGYKKMDGYFSYNEERLFENPVQIEVENSRQIHSQTLTTRREEKQGTLGEMLGNGKKSES